MAIQKRSKTLSTTTRAQLAQGENDTVDFKRTPDGLSTDDLVAFANTSTGGAILLGVTEVVAADGTQQGSVLGCDVSDHTVLQILNKATSCIPPIETHIFIENLSDKPIIRLVVAKSENRPHCTPKGVYCVRDGSRNRPLHPRELLLIFLESEGRAFSEKFQSAADQIAGHLSELEKSIDSSIANIGSQLGWAEYKVSDTQDTSERILSYVLNINHHANDTSRRLRALFSQDGRADPIKLESREKVLNEVVKQLLQDRELLNQVEKGGPISMTAKGKEAVELDKKDLENILNEAVLVAKKQIDTAATEAKPPSAP